MADEDQSVDTFDAMSAAEFLAEQRRLENEALELAKPQQAAEAAALEERYRQGVGAGIRAMPTTPQQYQYGTVMPTSRGFMYVGSPVAAPAPGTPFAAERSFESAVTRQNEPAAQEAYQGLVSMGLRKPEDFLALPKPAPYPAPATAAEARYQPQQILLDMVTTGKLPADQAQSVLQGLSMTAGNRNYLGLTPAQALHYGLQQQRLASDQARQAAIQARFVPDAVKQQYRMLLGQEASASTAGDASASNRARFSREALEKQYPSLLGAPATATAPAAPAAPAPAATVTAPATATTTTPQKVTTKAQFDALPPGSIYIGKDGKRYRKP